MTYTVSIGTLNSTIPYHTIPKTDIGTSLYFRNGGRCKCFDILKCVKIFHVTSQIGPGPCWVGVLLCNIVVRALDLQSAGLGFDSRPPHCRVATLGKSFTRPHRL